MIRRRGRRSRSAGRVLFLFLLIPARLAVAQDLFARGDADCSITRGAADLVAAARGAGGESVCDNDDCERDGDVDAADVDCAARCLFGDCAVPANAPQVVDAVPEADGGVTPYAAIRVRGSNFDLEGALVQVTVGGVAAEILEIVSAEELLVLVPPLPPGTAPLVVQTGELVGAPISIEVGEQTPVGQADTLDATLELLDLVLERFAMLDLAVLYGDDTPIVEDAVRDFRAELAAQRAALAADPELTAEVRAELDAAIDSSGVPESLRAILVDIEALLAGGDAAETAGTVVAVGAIARNVRNTIAVARGAIAIAAGTGLSTTAGLVAVGVGVLGGVLTIAGSAALPPIITSLTLTDRNGAISSAVYSDRGVVVVRGARLAGTVLVLRNALGEQVFEAEETGDGLRQFRLSPTFGFCGVVDVFVRRPLALGESQHMYRSVQPELYSFYGTTRIGTGQTLSIETGAVAGCAAFGRFYPPNSGPFSFIGSTITAENSRTVQLAVPSVPSDLYQIEIGVGALETTRLGIQVDSALSGIDVRCSILQLKLSPGSPSSTPCTASLFPAGVRAPAGSRFVWSLSDPGAASIEGGGSEVRVVADNPGKPAVVCELKLGDRVLAENRELVQIDIQDVTGPSVNLVTIAPGDVPPGATIPVRVEAIDNQFVTRIVLRATGPGVVNPVQELACLNLEPFCSADFSVHVQEEGFADSTFTITGEAVDGSGNSDASETRTYKIAVPPDTACPLARITSPPSGGEVNAGSTVQVVAHADDDGDSDTGVRRFRYSASGPALVAPVMQELQLPMALPSSDLRFNFSVRPAAELGDVTDRTVVLRVEALDEAGNTCGPVVSTASVIGILDQCQGSIVTDNPSGYIDEPFTVTVTIAGDVAAQIVRVTSNNPGGQFDLAPRGNGVYAVTLFYQGRGSFTLRFGAFDDEGNERCNGAIALEALGPAPE